MSVGLRIEGVSYAYRRKSVLSDVTWTIQPGVTGILGPNGAGKSTLLSLMATLQKPSRGRIVLGDADLSTPSGRQSARRVLGLVPQRFTLAPEMRVHDTVAYAAWIHGVADRECDEAAARALDEVGLGDRGRDRVRALSGGQRQRVGLAAALAHDPQVILLDEPTAGLDPGHRLRLRERITHLAEGRTVVIASHLMEDIEHLCGHVGVLVEGRLAFTGGAAELHALAAEGIGADSPGSTFERAYDALMARLGAY
ncbi:ATP-binding cassette domain-containing protein [Phytoactinopolyspora limicola]|uniref:ATP-binding cassette domain-containing protein n=1 Tax=Phytoactinopolyspora limicola TaxID=2715536 RepID=UPI001A9C848A|nr:ATP-binding cassette domain-containing protein [Phytoactinopolyspora limicola]